MIVVFEFGSREGSLVALALFGLLFAVLGFAVGYRFRRARHAWIAGLLTFAVPVVLIYVSSLGGFYGLRIQEDHVALSYLLSPFEKTVPVDSIREIKAEPAFKLRWRLHIVTMDGRDFESATWNRPQVRESAERLHHLLLDPLQTSAPADPS